MPRKQKVFGHFNGKLKDFGWLKNHNALQPKAEKFIKQAMKSNQRILILGAGNQTGKNTLRDACLNYCYSYGLEPMLLPCYEGKNLSTFFNSKKWQNYSKILKMKFPTIFVASHEQANPDCWHHYEKKLHSKFDVIIDMRSPTKNKKGVFQIYKRTANGYKEVYTNKHLTPYYEVTTPIRAA